jgi:hypothetical protein
MAGETELVISGDGMPPTSVRGISETLEPINNPQFDKYRLTIQCSDMNAPAFDALRIGSWRRTVNGGLIDLSGNGSIVTVDCVSELAYKTLGGSPAPEPQRTAVSGSSRNSGNFTFYRPQLVVGLISKSQQTDEYGAVVQWQAEFEEI